MLVYDNNKPEAKQTNKQTNPSFVYTKADSYLQTQCLDCLYHLPATLTLALDVRQATALYAFVFNIAHVRLNVTVSAVWQH